MIPAVYRLLGLRYVLQRWDRAALIVASIALGVATLISARILNQCVEAAAHDTTTPAGGADLYVTNGEAGVYYTLAEDLRTAHIPGLQSVHPVVYDRVSLPQLEHRIAVLLGVEASSQLLKPDNPLKLKVEPLKIDDYRRELLPYLLPLGQALQEGDFTHARDIWERIPGQLVVFTRPIYEDWKRVREAARARNEKPPPFIVQHAGRQVECIPIGVIDIAPDSPLAPLGGNFVCMEARQASRVIRPGPIDAHAAAVGAPSLEAWSAQFPLKVNRIDLFVEPGADCAEVLHRTAEVLGSRAAVKTPEGQRRSTQEVVSGLQIGFLVCSAGAMIVGLFLVYNALAVTVAERRPDIGILRSLGATRLQIVVLFASAAAILGLIGAVLGVPLGMLLAEVTLAQFEDELKSMFLNPEVNPTRVTWANAALAVLAGVTTAVFAALVPAVQAATDDPAHVVRRTHSGAKGIWKLLHQCACLALLLAGFAAIFARHELPPRLGAIGGMIVVLVGLLLAAPILVGVMVTLLRPLVRASCGLTLRLAFDNLSRAPGRTGVVIGALGAGVAMMFQTAGVGRSNEEPVVEWISQVVVADQFVFAGNMTSANSSNSPMAEADVKALRALPAVERVMTIRYSRPEFNGTVVYLIALDAEAYARATRARVPNGLPDVEKFLDLPGTDDVLVSDNFALRHGVTVGQHITVPGPNGPITLRVIGTVKDYSWSRGTIFMDRARYAKLFGDNLVDMCHVFLKQDHPEASQDVEKYAAKKGLFVTDRDSLRKFLSELIGRVYLLAYLQQIVVGVVAALGVVTALLISVLQRKRELGLLLAVGATPFQVLRSVLAEAVLMGVLGTALGIMIGLPMEWYVLRVVLVEESGFVFDVVIPWKQALGIAIASIGTATIAGLLPAIHALRTRIPDAIQWE